MSIHESGEMYLETILILSERMEKVRSIDICEHMGFSKPSVSRAVGLLRKEGFIEVDKSGYLSLTDEGRTLALKMYERHKLLTAFFVELGVDEDIASEDACKIEHHISDETFAAIKRRVEANK